MKLTGKKYEIKMRQLQHEAQILLEEIEEIEEKNNLVRRKAYNLTKKPLRVLKEKLAAVKKQMQEI